MNLLDASLIGTLAGTVISQVWNVVENRKKSRLDVFLLYTNKYNDIMLILSDGVQEFSQEQQQFAIKFFSLLEEEFFLHSNRLLYEKIWHIWLKQIKQKMQRKFYQDAWLYYMKTRCDNPDFIEFMNTIIEKNRS